MRALIRISAAVLGAGVAYGAWLSLVLLITPRPGPAPIAYFMPAPFATALGFLAGTLIVDRLSSRPPSGLLRAYLWPLTGCVIGALVSYPFGPMLIVFGMFGLGTVAVAIETAYNLRARAAG
ncbi:MAG: hypothetical protein RBS78_02980 [Coriobacteriia bacterium]|jgi:hypothetical protein|nr:hypothetical protein [Coriobacteriia bacterium]